VKFAAEDAWFTLRVGQKIEEAEKVTKEKKPKEEPAKGAKGKGKGKGEEKEAKGKGKGKTEKEPKGKGKGKADKSDKADAGGVQKAQFQKVKTIRPDSSGLNLKVTVASIGEAAEKGGKRGGKGKPRQEAVIGDETACVTLQLSGDQVDTVKEGASLIIRNASVSMVKGFIKLTVDRWGKIEKLSDESPHKVNQKKDISATEYELVAL